MHAVIVCARSELRRRLVGTLVLVLLVGVIGGVVLAAAAGARRTSSAFERMLTAVHAADVLVNPDAGVDSNLDFDAVAGLPGVEEAGAVVGVLALPVGPDGEPDVGDMGLTIAPLDDRAFVTVESDKVLEGRQPDPSEPYEVLINPVLADQRDLEPGDTLPLLTGSFEQVMAADEAGDELPLTRVETTVTGIGISNDEIVDDEWWVEGRVIFTPTFYERHPESGYFVGMLARLHDGHEAVDSFRADVERLAGDEVIEFQTLGARRDLTNRAIRPSAIALALFAAVAGLAGLLVVAHALTRALADDRADGSTLASLGMTRQQRWLASMARVALDLGRRCRDCRGRCDCTLTAHTCRRRSAGRTGPRPGGRRSGAHHRSCADRTAADGGGRAPGLALRPQLSRHRRRGAAVEDRSDARASGRPGQRRRRLPVGFGGWTWTRRGARSQHPRRHRARRWPPPRPR